MSLKPQTLETLTSEDHTDETELEKLEADVNQMAQTILHYRATLPDQLKNTLASILAAHRPVVPLLESGSEPGPSGDPNPDAGGQVKSEGALLAEEDQETAEKIRLLKHKISSNISDMPIMLKRMKECISMFDKLDSYNGIVHPAFKRKRTS